jgi:hypothetical protein
MVIRNKKIFIANPLFPACLVFILLSAFAVAISRVGYGPDAASSSRYRLIPVLLLAIIYIAALNCNFGKSRLVFYTILAGSICLYSARLFNNYLEMSAQKDRLTKGMVSYLVNPKKTTLTHPNQQFASWLMTWAIAKNFYKPPEIHELVPAIRRVDVSPAIIESNRLKMRLEKVIDRSNLVYISGWAFIADKKIRNPKIWLVLKSSVDTIFFTTVQVKRPGVAKIFQNFHPGMNENCGFLFILEKTFAGTQPLQYQVGIAVTQNDKIMAMKFSGLKTFINQH